MNIDGKMNSGSEVGIYSNEFILKVSEKTEIAISLTAKEKES